MIYMSRQASEPPAGGDFINNLRKLRLGDNKQSSACAVMRAGKSQRLY